jgi:hypothetical protein
VGVTLRGSKLSGIQIDVPAETLAEIEGMLVLEEVMPAKPTPIRNSLVRAIAAILYKSYLTKGG